MGNAKSLADSGGIEKLVNSKAEATDPLWKWRREQPRSWIHFGNIGTSGAFIKKMSAVRTIALLLNIRVRSIQITSFLVHYKPKDVTHHSVNISCCVIVTVTPKERTLIHTDCIYSLLIARKLFFFDDWMILSSIYGLLNAVWSYIDYYSLNDLPVEQNSPQGPWSHGGDFSTEELFLILFGLR